MVRPVQIFVQFYEKQLWDLVWHPGKSLKQGTMTDWLGKLRVRTLLRCIVQFIWIYFSLWARLKKTLLILYATIKCMNSGRIEYLCVLPAWGWELPQAKDMEGATLTLTDPIPREKRQSSSEHLASLPLLSFKQGHPFLYSTQSEQLI